MFLCLITVGLFKLIRCEIVKYTNLPFLIKFLPNKGSRTGSTVSPIFSNKTVSPLIIAFSIVSKYPFCPSRITRNFSPYFCLIHLTPCSCYKIYKCVVFHVVTLHHIFITRIKTYTCGSIISGQRSELESIVAFSVLIRSEGRPSFCHIAIVVSSVSMVNGSKPSVIGIGG